METMPYQSTLDTVAVQPVTAQVVRTDWQRGLPVLTGQQVVLRELRASDAPSLFALLPLASYAN